MWQEEWRAVETGVGVEKKEMLARGSLGWGCNSRRGGQDEVEEKEEAEGFFEGAVSCHKKSDKKV